METRKAAFFDEPEFGRWECFEDTELSQSGSSGGGNMVFICCSVSVLPPKKQQKIGVEYFLLKFIMHRDRPVKGRETRQDENTRRLPYYTNMAEKNDKKRLHYSYCMTRLYSTDVE